MSLMRVAASFIVVAIAGCVRSSTPPRPAHIPSIPIAEAHGGDAIEPAPSPSEIACTFAHANASFDVSLRRDGPVYARIDAVDDVLSIPTGGVGRAVRLVHAAHGVHIETFVETRNLDLYVTKPVAFSGWYVPYASSTLRWTSGSTGTLALAPVIESQKEASVQLTIFEKPHAVLPCDAISVTPKEDFDALDEHGGEAYVRVNEAIPLSRAPGASAIATIRFSDAEEAKVEVLERKASAVRVAITAWAPATLTGWIPDAVLVPPPTLAGGHTVKAPEVRFGAVQRRNVRTVTCASAVPLRAQTSDGTRARIGEIEAGATFVFYAGDGDEREVQLRGVRPLEETRLLVPKSVEGCK